MLWAQKQKGFTIVELLIVVVVIAILAAITIVAYNGISNRAKASAAQTAASSVGKKVAEYATLNAELYPTCAGLAAATGFTPSNDGTTPYQCTVAPDQKSFCMTVTTNQLSYYVSNGNLSPTAGACIGHNLNGVYNPITNMIANPSLEAGSGGWALHASLSGGRISSGGKWVYQGTRTAVGATAMYISQAVPMTVTTNTTYTGSVLLTSSVNQSISLQIRIGGTTSALASATTALVADVPTRISVSGDVGSTSNVYLAVLSANGTIGDVLTADEAMFVVGPTAYSYADGNSVNWTWSGTPDLSPSSGPAL